LKRALNEAAEEAAKKSAEQTMALMKGMNLKIPGF
jgi:DNA-binding protein YbaB